MGLFSFTQEVAIDLGTANTIITCNDKMVVDEPSVIALDARSDKVLAVGKVAREMYEKTHPNIRTVRPLREGVIADFYAAEQMIRGFIKMASGRKRWFAPSLRMVIGIPSGSTEVEIRAVGLDDIALFDIAGTAKQYDTDIIFFQIQHHAIYIAGEL